MVVYTGSASIDERGKARGGNAGDQTGREVCVKPWYKHSLGWVVIRAKDAAARKKIAEAMRKACDNPKIGYDQNQRDTLYNAVKTLGFDPSKAITPVETDCSALVRVCCAYAGITLPSFRTHNEPAVLRATGKFDVFSDAAHTDHPDLLLEGDILCTRVSGHTIVVLNDGAAATAPLPETVKIGSRGDAVKKLQTLLNSRVSSKPLIVDGEFGKKTDAAVRTFQTVRKLEVDGIVGPKTWTELLA